MSEQGVQGEGRVNLYIRMEKQQKGVCQGRGYREKVGLTCTYGWRDKFEGGWVNLYL